MPANVVPIDKNKKHLTTKEKNKRRDAEEKFKRETVKLKKPTFLKDNKTASKYWQKTTKSMQEIHLLDDVDSDMLGRYCCIAARLESMNKKLYTGDDIALDDDLLKRIEATERNMLSYAEKLGLTPSGRVRLAKKTADKVEDPDDDLYGS